MTSLSAGELKEYMWEAKDKEGVFFIPNPFYNQGIVLLDAVRLAQDEYNFMLFTNGLNKYREHADVIDLGCADFGDLPKEDYLDWVASCKLLLQVNASDYTITESLAVGTPVLMSPAVAERVGVCEEKLIMNSMSVHEISLRIRDILTLDTKNYEKLCKTFLNFKS